ncbi:MAG: hypothetical protein KJO29_13305 [Bacteroidia bacterium]|nr:hypothetical protein [Bacteroidia bacterium]
MKQDNTHGRIDRGWDKMVLTLDEKMPVRQEKDRRFFLLFWFLTGIVTISFLYIGIAGFFNQSKGPNDSIKNIAAVEHEETGIDTQFETATIIASKTKNDKAEATEAEVIHSETQVEETEVLISEKQVLTVSNASSKEPISQIITNNDPNNPDLLKSPVSDNKTHVESPSLNESVQDVSIAHSRSESINSPTNNSTGDISIASSERKVAFNEHENADHVNTSVQKNLSQLKSLSSILPQLDYTSEYLSLDYDFSKPVSIELNTPVQTSFSAGIDAMALQAPNLGMWGAQGRISGLINMNKTSIGPFFGYGHLSKSGTSDSESLTAPIGAEDIDLTNEVFNQNPGKTSHDFLSSLNYLDFGLTVKYQLTRPLSLGINGGLSRYFSVDPITVQRVDSGALGASSNEPINILIEDKLIPFTEIILRWEVTPHFGFNIGYHHEFSPVIDQADESFYGHRVSLGMGYIIN